MKKILSIIVILASTLSLQAQNAKQDTTGNSAKAKTTKSDSISLDLLNAPSSPAFNLLGIAPSDIERPTDMNSFRASIQNATGNFSKLPSSYAVEFTPASLLKLNNQTLNDLGSIKFGDVFSQSFTVSFGLTQGKSLNSKTNDSVSFTKLGFGVKFSIIRPRFTNKTQKEIVDLENIQKKYLFDLNPTDSINTVKKLIKEADSLHNTAKRDSLVKKLAKLDSIFANNETANLVKGDSGLYKQLKTTATNLKIERSGAFLDFAGGIALDFPTDKFDFSLVEKAGAWLTGGYEGGNDGFSALGIARYLYQPDAIFDDPNGTLKTNNISTFDMGARILYTTYNSKFTASTEAIYRSVLNKNTIPSSWRLVLNLEYNVGNNQKLTFSFGRNFDGNLTTDGNLISALNYIIGFGSAKQIHSSN
ncbi:MAG TPA: hypothetical protein VHE59_19320 [Mucilaginibacter sp.]|nr:hypothetical protein [Mucilaginibacter sp.]